MVDPLYAVIGRIIRDRRKRLGMTQAALAARLQLSRTSVTNIEAGHQPLMAHQLFVVVDILRIDMIELVSILRAATMQAPESLPTGFDALMAKLQSGDGKKT